MIYALPSDSTLIEPTLTSGRWLLPADENAIVIGNHLLEKRPDLKVGDTIVLKINERESNWQIVGTYEMAGNVIPPLIYANREYLAQVLNQADRVVSLRIVTEPDDPATQLRVAKELEARFKAETIGVSSIDTGAVLIGQQQATTDVLVYFLLVMAVLIALVGGLGLMSTMSMNVMERTRELGVMRSIGASNGAIRQLVLAEGVMVGLLSWVIAVAAAQPLSLGLCNVIGVSLLRSPLEYAFSLPGLLLWLGAVLVISALASLLPARSATRLTVREVLAYE